MQKERGYLRQIAEGVLVIGFSVQIVLGLVWIALHLSLDLLSWGKMLAVFLAAYITLRELGCAERRKCLWGTLVLFTFPMLAQEYFTGSMYALLCVGGLGILISERVSLRAYHDVGMILLTVFVVVMTIDLINDRIRSKIL